MRVSQAERHDEPIDFDFPLGEINPSLPVVLVTRATIHAMYSHAKSEMQHEVGGFVLGLPLRERSGGTAVTYIEESIRARYESTPTFVTLHADSFIDLEQVRGDRLLVGWYHSHPRLGIFLSGTDIRNYSTYHPDPYQVAVVVDPSKTKESQLTAHSEAIGFFAWKSPGVAVRLEGANIGVVESRPLVLRGSDTQAPPSDSSLS